MADNTNAVAGSGDVMRTDDIGGVKWIVTKAAYGDDGSATMVSATNRMPAETTSSSVVGSGTQATAQRVTLATDGTVIGAVGETAPASDTASSGLNGRLQRIAQRITSLIALLPASLGTKTAAASLAVTLASDDVIFDVLPASLGPELAAASFSVTLASDHASLPITVDGSKISATKVAGATINADVEQYATGDLVGTKITLSNVIENNIGIIDSVILRTTGLTTNGGFALIMFDADPSATTFTDNAAFDIDPTDIEKVIMAFKFPTANFASTAAESFCTPSSPDLPLYMVGASSEDLYCAVVAQGTSEWAVVDNGLALTFIIRQL